MNNVVLVSGVQQSDLIIRTHVSILFQIKRGFLNWEGDDVMRT